MEIRVRLEIEEATEGHSKLAMSFTPDSNPADLHNFTL